MTTTTTAIRPWVLAARPATLWAAVAPVVVGSALSWHEGAFRLDVLIVALVAAVAIQVGVNFANDLSDGIRGTDGPDRIGPTRAVAAGLISPDQMRRGIVAVFGVAVICGIYLTWVAGWPVIAIGVASIVAALGYTGGPRPYGYAGLGELFVFVFFGLVATAGTRFVHDGTVTAGAWPLGVAMGALATAILIANNVRDIDTDRRAGKRTLAVRLGRSRAIALYGVCLLAAGIALAVGVVARWLPGPAVIAAIPPVLAAPRMTRRLTAAGDGPAMIAILKATARLQMLVAAAFVVAIALA